ncbi:type II toxin-antitoxin system VapC family toxin [soil metagenome]
MGSALIVLLDTSALIWAMSDPDRLSAPTRAVLESSDGDVWASAASAWEIATKHRLGRLDSVRSLLDDWVHHLDRFGFRQLDITHRHALHAGGYDVSHGDPFDRVIAAQAELEAMALVANDRAFDLFPITRLWT